MIYFAVEYLDLKTHRWSKQSSQLKSASQAPILLLDFLLAGRFTNKPHPKSFPTKTTLMPTSQEVTEEMLDAFAVRSLPDVIDAQYSWNQITREDLEARGASLMLDDSAVSSMVFGFLKDFILALPQPIGERKHQRIFIITRGKK